MDNSSSTDNQEQTPEFGKLRQMFWPIHRHELKKFLPMSMLMFCILFVYTMVRDLKDSFIQHYAVCGGAELLPILKLFFVMPAAFLAVMLFTFLISKFGSTKTFYIMVSIFIAFYAVFVLFLFPNVSWLHANAETVRHLQEVCPKFLYFTIPCITNWSYTLFYVMSEIWGTIAIQSLFWQLANKITKSSETKRFYGLYSLISSVGTVCSGGLLRAMSHARGEAFDRNVKILIGLCILLATTTLIIFKYINTVVMTDRTLYNPHEIKVKKKKEKVDVFEGIRILFKSPYIGFIAVIILSYGIADNLIENMWKAQMRIAFSRPNDYARTMATHSILVGIFTIVVILLSTFILQKFSWKFCASIPAVTMLLAGMVFFGMMVRSNHNHPTMFGRQMHWIIAWLGVVMVAVTKSTKYSLFDSTKNMAYRPLDEDTKTKGQAAVEVIGSRTGKAGSATINAALTNLVKAGSTISSHVYTIIVVFAMTLFGWLTAVSKLSKKYEAKLAENAEEKE